jgi:Flp pilus assembly protein TadG
VKELGSPLRSVLCRGRRPRRGRLRRSEDGSAIVEFAIIAPMFFFLMFVIAETALVFIAEQVMDNAVFETARLIRTGQVQSMTDAEFKAAVCGRMSVFIDCNSSNFYIDVQSFDTFNDMVLTPPLDDDEEFEEPEGFDFGSASKIVVMRVYYQWPTNPVLGILSLKNLANGKRLIGSFAAFCNEPYQSAAGQCGG